MMLSVECSHTIPINAFKWASHVLLIPLCRQAGVVGKVGTRTYTYYIYICIYIYMCVSNVYIYIYIYISMYFVSGNPQGLWGAAVAFFRGRIDPRLGCSE